MTDDERVAIPRPGSPADHGINLSGHWGAAMLATVPEIAQAVALTIAHMADVDMTFQQIAIGLVGREGLAAATILGSIRSHEQTLRIVHSLLEDRSQDADKALIRRVKKAVEPIRAIRNDFAHGIWGAPANLPDHLLLTRARLWNAQTGAARQLDDHADSDPLPMFLNALLDGGSGSRLSAADSETALRLLHERSKAPSRLAAVKAMFDQEAENSLAQVWSIDLAWQAVAAADAASQSVIGLQTCIARGPQEAVLLRSDLLSKGLLTRRLESYRSRSST